MAHRIGIIGPTRSVERILAIAQTFEHAIEFVPFPFEDERDIIEILQENREATNGWLFSGSVTYFIAKEYLPTDDNIAYCEPMGAGFYINLLQMAVSTNALPRFSVDMFESLMDIERFIQETGINWQDVHIRYYRAQYGPEEIIQFHLQLWRQGKIDGAITALRSVYHALQTHGVPVYQFTLTEQEIYQSLKIIIEKVKASYFKTTQVGLVLLEIGRYDEIIEKAKTPYVLQALELKLKELLLPLCENLDGYLLDKGTGVYEIFSSRGAVEREIPMLRNTVQQLFAAVDCKVPVAAGIGYGATVFAAGRNAHCAIRNAREKQSNEIIIVQDNGVIVEAGNEETQVSYSYYSHDQELLDKLHTAAVSVRIYQKIAATVRRMGWDTFTAIQLARQLSVTEQNIRRIMTGLCTAGLAAHAGEEIAASRGRPGKLYRLV